MLMMRRAFVLERGTLAHFGRDQHLLACAVGCCEDQGDRHALALLECARNAGQQNSIDLTAALTDDKRFDLIAAPGEKQFEITSSTAHVVPEEIGRASCRERV